MWGGGFIRHPRNLATGSYRVGRRRSGRGRRRSPSTSSQHFQEDIVNKFVVVAFGALGALVAGTGSAWAAPAWCKGAAFAGEVELRDLSSQDPRKVVLAFAQAACAPTPEAQARRSELEKSRQSWGQRLGMVESDWADVVAWVSANEGRDVDLQFSTNDVTRFTPLDEYKAITEGFRLPNGNGDYKDPIYVADVLDRRLSEVGRYGLLIECMKAETSVASSAPPAAEWAICQADVEKFDLTKFYADLRADTAHGGDAKMELRFAALEIKKRLKDHAAAVQATWRKDPVYKRMFEVAAESRTEWAAGLGKQSQLLDLVQQMDSAVWSNSRKQYTGCEEKTAAALATAVSKVPASAFKSMKDERFDPYGGFAQAAGPVLLAIPEVNLASIPYVLCHHKSGTATFLAYYLGDTVGFRGPRTTAFSRLLGEKFTLDDMNERLYWPSIRRMYTRSSGSVGSAGGVIASTRPDGDFIRVTPERYLVKRMECIQSHRTNRISRILPTGEVQYEEVCDKSGMVARDHTWADFSIRKSYAPLLAKGVKFSAVNGEDGTGADIVVVWPNKNAELPSWLLGAKVK
ncbi:MAG: hypothetical protein ACTHU0_07375 [Kofleriaceae bacterium]